MSDWALPEINLLLCNRCGDCVDQCPGRAVEMSGEAPTIVRPADCSYCAICETICPVGAIACPYEIVWGE
jgi:NAD-dependent dihydropyrimidine dehydrogenase PreA subunit